MIRTIALSLSLVGCADLVGIRDSTTDVQLSNLEVHGATLVPPFDPDIHAYEIAVTYGHPTIEIAASAADPTISVEVSGEGTPQGIRREIAVPIGKGEIEITTRTTSNVEAVYTIATTRADFRIELVPGAPATAAGMVTKAQVADLDGDGNADLVYQQYPGSPSSGVGVLLGDGTGGFRSGWYSSFASARGVAVADVMGDAALDLVITDGSLLLLRGRGDGSFDAAFPRGLGDASAIAAGRLDMDTRTDLVVGDGGGRVTAFFGDAGTMVYGPTWQPSTVQFEPRSIAIANVDGQPGPEVVQLDGTMNTIVITSMMAPAAAFQLGLPAAAAPREMVVVDLDGDGRSEIVWLDPYIGTLSIQQGSAVPMRVVIPLGDWTFGLAAGDIDGDGAIDLAMIQKEAVLLLHNKGQGGFNELRFPLLAAGATSIAIADLDKDGHGDLVLPRSTSSIGIVFGRVP